MKRKKLKVDWARTFKNNFIKNEFGYATFFDYYFERYRAQDVLTECRKFQGKWAFFLMYFKLFKYSLIKKYE